MQAALLATVMPAGPAFNPASTAFWNSPLWKRAQAASTLALVGKGSLSPACNWSQYFLTLATSNGYSFVWAKAVHRVIIFIPLPKCGLRRTVSADQALQERALAGLQIRHQQIQDMVRTPQQGRLRIAGFQRVAWVPYILKTQPVGQHHHNAGGGGFHL